MRASCVPAHNHSYLLSLICMTDPPNSRLGNEPTSSRSGPRRVVTTCRCRLPYPLLTASPRARGFRCSAAAPHPCLLHDRLAAARAGLPVLCRRPLILVGPAPRRSALRSCHSRSRTRAGGATARCRCTTGRSTSASRSRRRAGDGTAAAVPSRRCAIAPPRFFGTPALMVVGGGGAAAPPFRSV